MNDKMSARTLLFTLVVVIFQIQGNNGRVHTLDELKAPLVDSWTTFNNSLKEIVSDFKSAYDKDIAHLQERITNVTQYYNEQIINGTCSPEQTDRCYKLTSTLLPKVRNTVNSSISKCYEDAFNFPDIYPLTFMDDYRKHEKQLELTYQNTSEDCSREEDVEKCMKTMIPYFRNEGRYWRRILEEEESDRVARAKDMLKDITPCVRNIFRKLQKGLDICHRPVMTCVKCGDSSGLRKLERLLRIEWNPPKPVELLLNN